MDGVWGLNLRMTVKESLKKEIQGDVQRTETNL